MTTYDLAQRYVGIRELAGAVNHPLIQWWHSLCGFGPETPDEVPWCSSFTNGIAWELRLPRSKSASARSWLKVGVPVALKDAQLGDVVILTRGPFPQPGPDVTAAPGHVGFFAGAEHRPLAVLGEHDVVLVLGGNQGDGVSIAPFPVSRVLGVRRLT
jgi:uncharacterized protein (TIGR02594 family)